MVEIYKISQIKVREQFQQVKSNFSTGNKASYLQEVERILNQTEADLTEKDSLANVH